MSVKKLHLDVWKALGAVDAGRVDLKADRNGRICFMEVNPLAGLHPDTFRSSDPFADGRN